MSNVTSEPYLLSTHACTYVLYMSMCQLEQSVIKLTINGRCYSFVIGNRHYRYKILLVLYKEIGPWTFGYKTPKRIAYLAYAWHFVEKKSLTSQFPFAMHNKENSSQISSKPLFPQFRMHSSFLYHNLQQHRRV